ncbi:MAG: hypothetical protein FWH08_04420 [Oscillospiraceae bacterium]|nr:hypothetical protein [Oscillospiraceae bacterium]
MLPHLGIVTWKEETLSNLTAKILKIANKPLILIDGYGGSGKTTLAGRIVDILKANLVSTDDVCWYSDPTHWDGEMLNGIIQPWLNGKNVAYKPTGWVKENRQGFIEVDSSKPLVIEGMGACRKTLRKFATYSVWVDAEPDIARTRVIKRDIAAGENGGTLESVTKFTDWWDSLVHPFLLEEKPWKHVNIIVSGAQSDLSSDNPIFYVADNLA